MQRVVTAIVGIPLAFAAVLLLPPRAFFLLVCVILGLAMIEYIQIAARRVSQRSLWILPLAALGAALAMSPAVLPGGQAGGEASRALLLATTAFSVGLGCWVLFTQRTESEAAPTLGWLGYAVPYFAAPIAGLYHLQRADPWLVVLLFAVVWLGDSAAFYIGTHFGRHRLAPMVSPKKSWEGAIASLAMGVAAAAVWSFFRIGHVEPGFLLVGGVTSVASQLGDLVESLFKRGAEIKDSGAFLPGHGGMLDGIDGLLFAAPVLLLAVRQFAW